MARFMELKLEKRGVSCVARLLDTEAPITIALPAPWWKYSSRRSPIG